MDVNDYFRTETNKRLEQIETKLDQLLAFKWQIITAAGLIGTVFSLAATLTIEWLRR